MRRNSIWAKMTKTKEEEPLTAMPVPLDQPPLERKETKT
jgi:hypothetical protein